MEERGLVSVVTATYNMAGYIGETLDSIMAQDYPYVESIVIDDGSTDNTDEILAPYVATGRVRVIRQDNAGQTVAKNCGIGHSRGEFIAFCDADDVWRKDKLTKQVAILNRHPEVAVVFSDIDYIDGESKPYFIPAMKRVGGRITGDLLLDNFIPFPSTIVRAKVISEVGGFDESLTMSIDYDLWLRISVDHPIHYIEEPLASYRIWEGQMSKKLGERLDNFFLLLDRFVKSYPNSVTDEEVDQAWAHVYITRGQWHASEGRKRAALYDYWTSSTYRVWNMRLLRRLGALVLNRD